MLITIVRTMTRRPPNVRFIACLLERLKHRLPLGVAATGTPGKTK